MITIKLPYKTSNINNDAFISNLMSQYSNVVRYSFNRYKENVSQKDIRLLTKKLNNITDLNSWFVQCAIKDAEAIYKRNPENKVIFGGKKQFYRRLKNLISNSEYKLSRQLPINIQGEMLKKGNRTFKLDIIDNNQIIFKVNKNKHIKLELPKIRNNYKKLLYKLETLNNVKQGEYGHTFSVRINSKYIYLTFDDNFKGSFINNIKTRYIGIDLNPNEIGISIKDGDKILEVRKYILNISMNNHDKVRHEVLEISKKISNLFKSYNCKFIFIEDLTIKSKNHNKGKKFNKLINNWIRNEFINNLDKRIKLLNGKMFKINPAYSSFIGNMIYDFEDSINASLEIGRRGYEVIILKNKKFYPELNVKLVKDQWKEYLIDNVKSWKDFFNKIKNSKLKYRVSSNIEVFSHLSKRSNVNYYFLYPN